jgi:hypothetical protein
MVLVRYREAALTGKERRIEQVDNGQVSCLDLGILEGYRGQQCGRLGHCSGFPGSHVPKLRNRWELAIDVHNVSITTPRSVRVKAGIPHNHLVSPLINAKQRRSFESWMADHPGRRRDGQLLQVKKLGLPEWLELC